MDSAARLALLTRLRTGTPVTVASLRAALEEDDDELELDIKAMLDAGHPVATIQAKIDDEYNTDFDPIDVGALLAAGATPLEIQARGRRRGRRGNKHAVSRAKKQIAKARKETKSAKKAAAVARKKLRREKDKVDAMKKELVEHVEEADKAYAIASQQEESLSKTLATAKNVLIAARRLCDREGFGQDEELCVNMKALDTDINSHSDDED